MLLVLLALSMLVGCQRHRPLMPVFPGGRPTPETVLQVWLAKSCNVGEEADLEREMRRIGDPLTLKLIEAFESGPPAGDRVVVEAHARRELVRMKAELDRLGVPEDDKWLIRDRVEARHVQEALDTSILNYKSAALSGLGVIWTAEARRYLTKVNGDTASTFQEIAGVILQAGGR